jgi:hypothetical protein
VCIGSVTHKTKTIKSTLTPYWGTTPPQVTPVRYRPEEVWGGGAKSDLEVIT